MSRIEAATRSTTHDQQQQKQQQKQQQQQYRSALRATMRSLPGSFRRVAKQCDEESRSKSTTIADRPENAALNRDRRFVPFNANRVPVDGCQDGRDYINASWIRCGSRAGRCIVAQCPKTFTAGHFWRMVWQRRASCVVTTTDSSACSRYFPDDVGSRCCLTFANAQLRVEISQKIESAACVLRRLCVSCPHSPGRLLAVAHLQLAPSRRSRHRRARKLFLDFCSVVGRFLENGRHAPVVIHDSAAGGCGRAGALLLIASCQSLMESGASAEEAAPLTVLRWLRSQRLGLLQTVDELRFSCRALLLWLSAAPSVARANARSNSWSEAANLTLDTRQ